jgi:plasmid maintenance system antidote protein VapI
MRDSENRIHGANEDNGIPPGKDLDFPGIYCILRGKRSISAETALRLGKYFGLPAQFWMNLQSEHDLRLAAAPAKLENVRVRTAA